MVKKHIAQTGKHAGQWVDCVAENNCRLGGAHVSAEDLKNAKIYHQHRTGEKLGPIGTLSSGTVLAWVTAPLNEKAITLQADSSQPDVTKLTSLEQEKLAASLRNINLAVMPPSTEQLKRVGKQLNLTQKQLDDFVFANQKQLDHRLDYGYQGIINEMAEAVINRDRHKINQAVKELIEYC